MVQLHLQLCCVVLCLLTAEAVAKRVQVFGFSPEQKLPTYKGYDWSLLTTTAWRTDPELIDLAQQHGTKVEVFGGQGAELMPIMGHPAKRKKWVRCTSCAATVATSPCSSGGSSVCQAPPILHPCVLVAVLLTEADQLLACASM